MRDRYTIPGLRWSLLVILLVILTGCASTSQASRHIPLRDFDLWVHVKNKINPAVPENLRIDIAFDLYIHGAISPYKLKPDEHYQCGNLAKPEFGPTSFTLPPGVEGTTVQCTFSSGNTTVPIDVIVPPLVTILDPAPGSVIPLSHPFTFHYASAQATQVWENAKVANGAYAATEVADCSQGTCLVTYLSSLRPGPGAIGLDRRFGELPLHTSGFNSASEFAQTEGQINVIWQ